MVLKEYIKEVDKANKAMHNVVGDGYKPLAIYAGDKLVAKNYDEFVKLIREVFTDWQRVLLGSVDVEDNSDGRLDTYHINITVNYFFDGYPCTTFFVVK